MLDTKKSPSADRKYPITYAPANISDYWSHNAYQDVASDPVITNRAREELSLDDQIDRCSYPDPPNRSHCYQYQQQSTLAVPDNFGMSTMQQGYSSYGQPQPSMPYYVAPAAGHSPFYQNQDAFSAAVDNTQMLDFHTPTSMQPQYHQSYDQNTRQWDDGLGRSDSDVGGKMGGRAGRLESGCTGEERTSFGTEDILPSMERSMLLSTPFTPKDDEHLPEDLGSPPAKKGKELVCPHCDKGYNFSKTNRGRMCTSCHRAKTKATAPNSRYALLPAIDEPTAWGKIYPVSPALQLEGDDVAAYALENNYIAAGNLWVKRFVEACNTPTAGDDSSNRDQAYYVSQQKAFNVARFTSEQINVRLRMLFIVAYRYHAGGPAVYPTGGDNDGYHKNSKLIFSARLEEMRAMLALDKRVCLDILHGRGAVAFMENPAAYQRRKVQNKAGNAKKDQLRKLGEKLVDEVEEGQNGDEKFMPTSTAKMGRADKVTKGRKRKQTESVEPESRVPVKRQQTATLLDTDFRSPPLWTPSVATPGSYQSNSTAHSYIHDPFIPMAGSPVVSSTINGLPFRRSLDLDPKVTTPGTAVPIQQFDHRSFISHQLSPPIDPRLQQASAESEPTTPSILQLADPPTPNPIACCRPCQAACTTRSMSKLALPEAGAPLEKFEEQ